MIILPNSVAGASGTAKIYSVVIPDDVELARGAVGDRQAIFLGYLFLLTCLLYTSPSPRDATLSRMPSSA